MSDRDPGGEQAPTPLFLISLPRSGSTLLQRILATHPSVATGPEPTFLLPLLHLASDAHVAATFDQRFTAMAIQDFLASTDDGDATFDEMVRAAASVAYRRASSDGATFFLDKTPKYHMVADEIIRVFPDAPVVVLWRNPLAVIASILSTWGRRPGRWNLHHFRLDLFHALPRLIEVAQHHADRIEVVQYEQLVASPHDVAGRVFSALGLSAEESDIDRFAEVDLAGRVQDPNVATEGFRAVRDDRIDQWMEVLGNPIRKVWCRRYLRWLGAERLAVMGYDLDELLASLDAAPTSTRYLLSDVVKVPYDTVYRTFELGMAKRTLRAVVRRQRPILAHK